MDEVTMPPKLAAAIAGVITEVQKVARADRNKQGGYNFVSVDNLLDMLRALMAKHGVFVIQDEVSVTSEVRVSVDRQTGQAKEALWLIGRYEFTIGHSSGEVSPIRPRLSAGVMAAMGAQAYGGMRSYALKYMLRSLFLVSTGEMDDPDFAAATAVSAAPAAAPVPEWYAIAEGFKQRIDAATSVDAVNEILIKVEAEIPSETARGFLIDRGKKARARLADAP